MNVDSVLKMVLLLSVLAIVFTSALYYWGVRQEKREIEKENQKSNEKFERFFKK